MRVRVVVPPASEPISLEEARLHLKLDVIGGTNPDDALIERLISAARKWAEKLTGLALGEQTWEVALDDFPFIATDALPGGPVSEILSVKYREDAAGTETTLASSRYYLDAFTGSVSLAYGQSWPSARVVPSGVRILYTVGAEPVDDDVRAAMLLVIGHLYANRENSSGTQVYSVPMGAESLLSLSRVNMGV
jgi:uncharacterized phiE125 gp8 family phage protein